MNQSDLHFPAPVKSTAQPKQTKQQKLQICAFLFVV